MMAAMSCSCCHANAKGLDIVSGRAPYAVVLGPRKGFDNVFDVGQLARCETSDLVTGMAPESTEVEGK